MDAQGHINNALFVDYLQEARVDFLLSGPPELSEMLTSGVLVINHQLEYLLPVTFAGRPIKINLWIDQVKGALFTIAYEVFDNDVLVARARTGAVPFDLATQSLRRLTAVERESLAPLAKPTEPFRELSKLRPTEASAEVDHVLPFRVRWSDLDSYNHVNNVKFFDYFQEARVDMLADVMAELADAGRGWVLLRQDVDYLRPIDFRTDPYEVRTIVSEVGRTSYQLAAEIRDPKNGEVFSRARSVVVAVDLNTAQPRPLDPDMLTRLGHWQPAQ